MTTVNRRFFYFTKFSYEWNLQVEGREELLITGGGNRRGSRTLNWVLEKENTDMI